MMTETMEQNESPPSKTVKLCTILFQANRNKVNNIFSSSAVLLEAVIG